MSQDSSHLITVYAQTDVGMVRAGNEDTFLVLNLETSDTWTPVTIDGEPPEHLATFSQGPSGAIMAVSDGMGGALAGEVASRMAVEGVREHMLHFKSTTPFSDFPFHEQLRLAVEQANTHINNESMGNADYAGMGATFTAAGVHNRYLTLAQIGDSRCYLVRDKKITLMTHDQSLVWQLVEAGHITEEEAETHQYKNVILQALGAQPRVNVVVDRVELSDGDVILLCSDGLSGRVRAEEMLKIVVSSDSLKDACDQLIQLANDRGGEDNITVILARFDGEALPPPGKVTTERVERDPNLPYEIDLDVYMDSEPTLNPDASNPITAEDVQAIASGERSSRKSPTGDLDQERPGVPMGHEITPEMAAKIARLNEETEFPVTTSVGMPALTLEEIAGHAAMMARDEEKKASPQSPAPVKPAPNAEGGNRTGQIIAILAAIGLVVALGWYVLSLQRSASAGRDQTLATATQINGQVKQAKDALDTLEPQIEKMPQGAQQQEAVRLRTTVSENIQKVRPMLEPVHVSAESVDNAKQIVVQIEADIQKIQKIIAETPPPAAPDTNTNTNSNTPTNANAPAHQ